jgi:hypothetical protein
MSYINTTIEKYQGKIPKRKKFIYAKIVKGHNIVDVTRQTWKPKCYVKRLFKQTFVNTKTGEVKEYMPKKDGIHVRNVRSLKVIFKNLKQLIETNFQGGLSNKFITLTYREQTADNKQVQNDLDVFNKRMKRAYPNLGYIHIVEPHASGKWHIHSLFKSMDGEPLEMPYDKIHAIWDKGWITVENLNNVDNLGAYFIAYFTNMEIDDEDLHKYPDDIKQMPRADGNGVKNVIKGARINFYPDYMKIYKSSRNLKQPEIINEIPKGFAKTYEATYKLTSADEDGNMLESFIQKEQHKR